MNSVTPSVRCDVLSRLEQRYGIDLYRATGKKTMPWHMARTLDRSAHGSIAAHTVDTPQANLCASAEFLIAVTARQDILLEQDQKLPYLLPRLPLGSFEKPRSLAVKLSGLSTQLMWFHRRAAAATH